MPKVRDGLVPARDARHGQIEDHRAAQGLGEATDIGVGHDTAEVVTHDIGPLQTQGLSHCVYISRQAGGLVAAGRRR